MSIDHSILPRLLLFAAFILAGCARAAVEFEKTPIYAEAMCGGHPSWSVQDAESGELTTHNNLEIGPSGTIWNGSPIDRKTLGRYLGEVAALNPQPVIVLIAKPHARCTDVSAIRLMLEARSLCSGGICVEYSQSEWDMRHPSPPR